MAVHAALSGPLLGRLSGCSVSQSKSVLYGVFVWVRRALKKQKRCSVARAGYWKDYDVQLRQGLAGPERLALLRGEE